MSDKQYPSNLYLESASTNIDFAKQVSVEAVVVMAKELLALRKAFSEPRGYEWVHGDGEVVSLLTHDPKAGDWSEQSWGDRKFRAIPLYRKPE